MTREEAYIRACRAFDAYEKGVPRNVRRAREGGDQGPRDVNLIVRERLAQGPKEPKEWLDWFMLWLAGHRQEEIDAATTRLTRLRQEEFLRRRAGTSNDLEACEDMNLSTATLHRWKLAYPEFAAKLALARR